MVRCRGRRPAISVKILMKVRDADRQLDLHIDEMRLTIVQLQLGLCFVSKGSGHDRNDP